MDHTTNTGILKREIFKFTEKITEGMARPFHKFAADLCYGAMASKSCSMSEIAQALQEDTQKINTIERLTRHLREKVPEMVQDNYLNLTKQYLPEDVVVHIDDSDVVKPCGRTFEGISRVRDGSKSTQAKSVMGNGGQFEYTKKAICACTAKLGRAIFVMDRGYDENDVFRLLDKQGQDYVIRLKLNRRVRIRGEKYSLEELYSKYRGKYKTKVIYHGRKRTARSSVVKGCLSASDRLLSIVLIFGLSDLPMVLATNLNTDTKDQLIAAMRHYFSRWRIEEYFRCKMQMFAFENFRVRPLTAINSLNFFLSACMLSLAILRETRGKNCHFRICIDAPAPLKSNVFFFYFRLAEGLYSILSKARSGIRGYFKPLRPNQQQMKIRGFA